MPTKLEDKKIIKIAEKTLLKYRLCDHCLGRVFAKIEHDKSNDERGRIIRKSLKRKKASISKCWLCEGLFEEIPHFVELVTKSLKGYEFDTFLIGCKIDEEILEKEKELFRETGDEYSEPIKTEVNREIGKILEKKLGKVVDFKDPTIMAVIDTAFDIVNLQIKSVFIYGRYKKFVRDIPQTRWFCRVCQGKGCRKCNYTGQLYENSVEQIVAQEFLIKAKAEDESFHGCGREDIDVRMLGNGRPFVLELKNPRCRSLNLFKLELITNSKKNKKVEVTELRFSDKDEVSRIKNAAFNKVYRLTVQCDKSINSEKLKKAAISLHGSKISQFTPSRVAHRRANMFREKQIYNCVVEALDGSIATLTLETESGTYIKELVSGDDERTKPNLSDMIGVPCKVKELDVIEIKGE